MGKLLKKLNRSREGATLVTVVIATAFLIAVGVILLTATTRYLVSVYMDRNSNANLYDAESILAEVRSGVLEYAGEAGAAAYKEVVENYGTDCFEEGAPLSLKDRFAQLYICGIIQQLEGGTLTAGITKTWNLIELNDLTIPLAEGEERDIHRGAFDVSSLQCLTRFPSAVKTEAMAGSSLAGGDGSIDSEDDDESHDLSYSVFKSATKGYYMTINNIIVDYTNEGNYRSSINTDFMITVPDYKFDGDDRYDDFLIVSDGKISVQDGALRPGDGSGEAAPVDGSTNDAAEFTGKIYTGGAISKTDDIKNPGIFIDSNMAARFNCELLVSRGSFDAYTGSKVEVFGAPDIIRTADSVNVFTTSTAGEFYVKNVRLLSNGISSTKIPDVGTSFSLETNAYVENDLDIQDAGTDVTIGGTYQGYSYNYDNTNDAGLAKSQSDYSSAILINGLSTNLHSADLKKLVLAGRTYVSRGTGATAGIDAVNDIMMGESVAVRSNQVAYLVPDKYIKNVQHNPITPVEAGYNGTDYSDPMDLVDVDALMESDIGKYLDEVKPVTGNYSQAEYDEDGYVFLFLNFKDQNSANLYFKSFYKDEFLSEPLPIGQTPDVDEPGEYSREDINDRAKPYIASIDGKIKLDPAYYLIAGSIINNYSINAKNDMSGFQDPTYFGEDTDSTVDPTHSQVLLDNGKLIGRRYVNLQKYLTVNGSATEMRLFKSDKVFKTDSGFTEKADETVAPLVKGDDSNSGLLDFGNLPTILTEIADSLAETSENIIEPETGALVQPIPGNDTYHIDSESKLGRLEGESGFAYGKCLVIHDGPVSIEQDCAGLIIANGDVTVSRNFKGLIIATGDVKVTNLCNLESDVVLVSKLRNFCMSNDMLSKIFWAANPDTHNTTVLEDCLRYINWEKNQF